MAVQDYFSPDVGRIGIGELLLSRAGLGIGAGALLVVLAGFRAALSPIVSPVHPVTWLGLVGGFVGGAFMSWIIGMGIDVHSDDLWRLRLLQFTHLLYGALGGALYPWVYKVLMNSPRELFITYPAVLNGTYMWSMIMFVLAAAVYLLVGTIEGVADYLLQWGGIIGLYIVYGVVLGFWLGLAYPVWYPLLGVLGMM